MKHKYIVSRGLSIIELLFSIVIGSAILLIAASMLVRSGDSYEQIKQRVASNREARSAMVQITSDLSTACYHKDSLFDRSVNYWPTDQLCFLSMKSKNSQKDSNSLGDLCLVNFYLKDLIIGGKTVRCLMRGLCESGQTFDALKSENLSSLFKENLNLDEPIALGVISFEARPKIRDEDHRWIDWVKNDTISPQGLEVKLVTVRQGIMTRLKHSSDWDGINNDDLKLGTPDESHENKNLEVYQAILRFGNHAKQTDQ